MLSVVLTGQDFIYATSSDFLDLLYIVHKGLWTLRRPLWMQLVISLPCNGRSVSEFKDKNIKKTIIREAMSNIT